MSKRDDIITEQDLDNFQLYMDEWLATQQNFDKLKDDYDEAIKTLRKIHKEGNTRSGKTTEARLAYNFLIKNDISLD